MSKEPCDTGECEQRARYLWMFPSGLRQWCAGCWSSLETWSLPGRFVGVLRRPERPGVLDKDVMDRSPEQRQYKGRGP